MVHFDEMQGVLGSAFRTKGRIDAFEHSLGAFETQHEERGHFLEGWVRIRFNGQDPTAAQSLGDPGIWRALAFRGFVDFKWDDSPHGEFDKALSFSYVARTVGDRTDLKHLREDVEHDLAAIDALVGSLVAQTLAGSAAGARA